MVGLIGNLASFPLQFLTAYLSTKTSIIKIYIVFVFFTILTGISTILQYDSIGSWGFIIGDMSFLVLDACSFILTGSMLYSKLLPDSRGVVTSILLVALTVFLIIQNGVNTYIQSTFDYIDEAGDKRTDFIGGGQLIITIYLGI